MLSFAGINVVYLPELGVNCPLTPVSYAYGNFPCMRALDLFRFHPVSHVPTADVRWAKLQLVPRVELAYIVSLVYGIVLPLHDSDSLDITMDKMLFYKIDTEMCLCMLYVVYDLKQILPQNTRQIVYFQYKYTLSSQTKYQSKTYSYSAS